MDLSIDEKCALQNFSKINIILGKNGCGKSSLLKKLEKSLKEKEVGEVNYVTPERGGVLVYAANVEQNSIDNEGWVSSQKSANQWTQFKSYSISQFRKLELLVLKEIEKDSIIRNDLEYTFDTIIDQINSLLTNIKIKRTDTGKGDFEIFDYNDIKINPSQISSGESELISLAIESLTFAYSCKNKTGNYLLLDEPDVHLHPDLQDKFMKFLIYLVEKYGFYIFIATHSTSILGALIDYSEATFAILKNGELKLEFKEISEMYKSILPIFGAHPLTNVFNQTPIFLVEGEDDVRIFQQAVRTSNGSLKLYPCSVGGKSFLSQYEGSVVEIIDGVYDSGKAYSFKDRDDEDEWIVDEPSLIRYKTSCRAAENLILCDEVLNNLGINWSQLKLEIIKWLETFIDHSKFTIMKNFQQSGYDRKNFDLKEIRNILVGLTPSDKPWEVAVGQVIGELAIGKIEKDFDDNKICNYLGEKFVNTIITEANPIEKLNYN